MVDTCCPAVAEWACQHDGTAGAKADRRRLQHGIPGFFKRMFKTFVIEQTEAISKSMSMFVYIL